MASSFRFIVVLLFFAVNKLNGFVVPNPSSARWLQTSSRNLALGVEVLFEEDQEMIPIAENYIRAKYKACAESHGHKFCNEEEASEILRSILPPVTPGELAEEVAKTLEIIMKSNPKNTKDKIDEDDFVKAIVKNSYWQEAGDLVVKELMYFDALFDYYQTGKSLLNDADYQDLKDSLTWDGSSVATMNKQEALFVTAVAASRRGEPAMEDDAYQALKVDLKKQGSWVTNRSQDALEKLGLDTFMGYLHRAL